MKAGSFKRNEAGTIGGKIQALGLGNLEAVFEERTSRKGDTYFKIIADPNGEPFEIGSAWPKQKGDLHYYSVSLDTAFSTQPINAALFPDVNDGNSFNLVWNRTPSADAKQEAKAEGAAEVQAEAEPEQLELATATTEKTETNKKPLKTRRFMGLNAAP